MFPETFHNETFLDKIDGCMDRLQPGCLFKALKPDEHKPHRTETVFARVFYSVFSFLSQRKRVYSVVYFLNKTKGFLLTQPCQSIAP